MQDTFVKQASESDLILIDKKVDTAAPWPAWAEQIIQTGFAIVSISPGMQSDFEGLQVLAGGVRFKDKQHFSFVERTDGYFPIGYSFLKEVTIQQPEAEKRQIRQRPGQAHRSAHGSVCAEWQGKSGSYRRPACLIPHGNTPRFSV